MTREGSVPPALEEINTLIDEMIREGQITHPAAQKLRKEIEGLWRETLLDTAAYGMAMARATAEEIIEEKEVPTEKVRELANRLAAIMKQGS